MAEIVEMTGVRFEELGLSLSFSVQETFIRIWVDPLGEYRSDVQNHIGVAQYPTWKPYKVEELVVFCEKFGEEMGTHV